jgi:hypothetical protein
MGRLSMAASFSVPAFREAMIAIRVQLGSMPQMLGDIVVHLLGALPDVDFVGRVHGDGDALEAARMTHADLLIVREPDGALGSILAQPDLSILQISADGQDGTLLKFDQHRMPLDRGSVDRIAVLIRGRIAGHA